MIFPSRFVHHAMLFSADFRLHLRQLFHLFCLCVFVCLSLPQNFCTGKETDLSQEISVFTIFSPSLPIPGHNFLFLLKVTEGQWSSDMNSFTFGRVQCFHVNLRLFLECFVFRDLCASTPWFFEFSNSSKCTTDFNYIFTPARYLPSVCIYQLIRKTSSVILILIHSHSSFQRVGCWPTCLSGVRVGQTAAFPSPQFHPYQTSPILALTTLASPVSFFRDLQRESISIQFAILWWQTIIQMKSY